jgi:hypothetical protein
MPIQTQNSIVSQFDLLHPPQTTLNEETTSDREEIISSDDESTEKSNEKANEAIQIDDDPTNDKYKFYQGQRFATYELFQNLRHSTSVSRVYFSTYSLSIVTANIITCFAKPRP